MTVGAGVEVDVSFIKLITLITFAGIFLSSYAGVEIFRRWSRRRNFLDVPNERSSHVAPTPRGGGAVIVFICLTAYAIYTLGVNGDFVWGYLAGALLITLISWLDDLYTISFVWRFLAHSVAAALVIVASSSFGEIYLPLGQKTIINESIGALLTFFWIVWMTNAYNFMDGIDGIAGLQSVLAGGGWLVIGSLLDLPTVEFYGGVIAFGSLGFLMQNWQPAKIFMGDVGSAFLGYTFAVMPLLASREATAAGTTREFLQFLPLLALIFNWLFVFDTIFTICRRALKKEKIWEAHRSHLYQRLVIAGLSHRAVTLLYGGLSLLTISLAVGWLVEREFWENLIILNVVLQAVGLLILAHAVRPRI